MYLFGLLFLNLLVIINGQGCEEPVDIVLMIDSSLSIRESNIGDEDNWLMIKQFLLSLVSRLPTGPDDVQVGLLPYSTQVDRDQLLHLNSNKTKLTDSINTLRFIGGNTNTADAIKVMSGEMFSSVQDRPGARNVGLLIADGLSNVQQDLTVQTARDARLAGVEVYTVGVTQYAHTGELRSLASDPPDHYHFWVQDFSKLNLLLDKLLENLCMPRPPARACRNLDADVAFLIDSSKSLADSSPADDPNFYWRRLTNFVTRVLESLELGWSNTRVAALKFSRKSKIIFHLNKHNESLTALQDLQNIEFDADKGTNISGALWMMRTQIFQVENGSRPDALNVAVLITDGKTTLGKKSTLEQAAAAHHAHIRLFVLGLTDDTDEEELQAIASEPVDDHYYQTQRLDEVDTLVGRLVWQICHEQCQLENDDGGTSLLQCSSRANESGICENGERLQWLQHKGHLLLGHNYARIQNVHTVSECQRLCLQDSRCQSLDYATTLEECAVSYVTREEVPERFVPEPDVDYYEWHCVAIES